MGEGVWRPDYMVPRKLDPSLGRISQAVVVLGAGGKDGELLDQPDGLLRALDLMAFPERKFPSPIEGTGSAQADWAAARDPLTGY
jgi:hypothetical protein